MERMKKYRIIDAHTHVFPQKIARKAVDNIGRFYGIAMGGDGSVAELEASGASAGVSRFIVNSSATTESQVRAINDFIAGTVEGDDRLIGLITLHPELSRGRIREELAFAAAHGLRGVKLHPDFQAFDIDDPQAMKIYEACEGVLPILFHTGDRRYHYSCPRKLARVAARFPGLVCIGAHFGGYTEWDEVECYDETPNVCFDTSSSLMYLPAARAVELIRKYGADRFLFGTDFPMWRHGEELGRFLALDLTEAEREAVFHGTAERVFGIPAGQGKAVSEAAPPETGEARPDGAAQ